MVLLWLELIIIVKNNSKDDVVSVIENNCNNFEFETNATLSNSSISIIINGNEFNHSSLTSNISIQFHIGIYSNDNDIQCVWLDETTNIWRSDGCETIINENNNKDVECLCDHLTTFATVHNINFNDECNDNLNNP